MRNTGNTVVRIYAAIGPWVVYRPTFILTCSNVRQKVMQSTLCRDTKNFAIFQYTRTLTGCWQIVAFHVGREIRCFIMACTSQPVVPNPCISQYCLLLVFHPLPDIIWLMVCLELCTDVFCNLAVGKLILTDGEWQSVSWPPVGQHAGHNKNVIAEG